MKKMKILTACFLAAFAVVGAGYAYEARISRLETESTSRAYGVMTGEDAAAALEDMSAAFSEAEKWGYGGRELGLIASSAGRAEAALGHLSTGRMKKSGVYSFVRACERLAIDCLSGIDRVEELGKFNDFLVQMISQNIDLDDIETIETDLERILLSPELESLMREAGLSELLSDSDFSSLLGMDTSRRDAIKKAEKYLGRNFGMKVSESELAYTVYAANISAIISKKGEFLIQLMFDLPAQEVKLSEDEAMQRLLKFLSETVPEHELLLCENFVLDGVYKGEFYPVRDGIVCLDEQIVAGVSAGSGRICLFDAGRYHRSRGKDVALPEGALSVGRISEMWGGAAVTPCKVRGTDGESRVCYKVDDFFVDPKDGRRLF